MKVAFQHLQVRAAGSETMLRGAFDAPGRLQVDGSLMMTCNDVESIAYAGKIVYDLALAHFPNEFDWWGIEYFYMLDHPSPTGLVVREMQPCDSGLFISRLSTPFSTGDEMSDRFITYLENSPYCYRVGWTEEYLQVQLSDTGLVYGRDEIHQMLLDMYMR